MLRKDRGFPAFKILGWTILIGMALFFVNNASAQIYFEDSVFPELAPSSRALAMGNAYMCKVDDAHAPFYNPAGLGTVRNTNLHPLVIYMETNKDLIRMGAGGSAADAASNSTKGKDLEGQRELLLENTGKLVHTRYYVMPHLIWRYFTAGFLYHKRQRSTLDSDAGAEFEFADRRDLGPYAGVSISFFGGVIKFGASGMLLNRKELVGTVPTTDPVPESGQPYEKTGTAPIINAGARVTLPWAWLPTFAGTILNAGGANFGSDSNKNPRKIRQTINVGFSITPQIGKLVRMHMEANLKDLGNAYGNWDEKYNDVNVASTRRRIGAGVEFDFARTFFIRAGWGDGYGTLGMGVQSTHLQVDLTTYAVESKTETFDKKEDRRFAFYLSWGF